MLGRLHAFALLCPSRQVNASCLIHLFCRYVDQGGGKRKGAFAIYLEPWHADIFDWLDLRKNHGKEEVSSPFHSGPRTSTVGLSGWLRPLHHLQH